MMNRDAKGRESVFGVRNAPPILQHRRGHSLTLTPKDAADDINLDLFSKNRRSLSVTSFDESYDVPVKLGRLSIGPAKVGRSGIDELLSSTNGGKHDFDWLLTPPETPMILSSEPEGIESQPILAAQRSRALLESTSTAKASRRQLSVSQSYNDLSSRPTRSSSVTRSSTSASLCSSYSSNRSSSILNTTSVSFSSYTRSSSPVTRSPSSVRPSNPSYRLTLSRPSTPSRTSSAMTTSSIDTRLVQSSRPSTPCSRPQTPAFSSQGARLNSRPSSPTRRPPVCSPSPASGPSISTDCNLSYQRNAAPASRPNYPGPRVRNPSQPVVSTDFPLETPANLKTSLPDRPVSAGHSRPGVAKKISNTTSNANAPRRHLSLTISRGRLTESQKATNVHDMAMKKPLKTSISTIENNGFGRTISKKSLDMAIRHRDIRNGSGNVRSLSSTTLFPQSVRSAISKNQSVHSGSTSASTNTRGSLQPSNSGVISGNGSRMDRPAENRTEADGARYSAKLTEVDIYESSRYDTILLKEDLKNTNWLHSIDDKIDQSAMFDGGFDPLPEPFGLL